MKKEILNIAAYKFIPLPKDELPAWRPVWRARAKALDIKGSILLSPEGINLFLAGTQDAIRSFQAFLAESSYFADLVYKESWSAEKPFSRMLVKLKTEIIAFGVDDIKPDVKTAPYLSPEELKQWYEEGRDMVVLDTRNTYEIELGRFKGAVDLKLDHFREFVETVDTLDESAKSKPVVTYCTGGIRCEKAAELMIQKGFKYVYQLDGGILNYFERCGADHYEGECFVFDKRVGVDATLQETRSDQCYACRQPLTLAEQQAAGSVCPHCGGSIGYMAAA